MRGREDITLPEIRIGGITAGTVVHETSECGCARYGLEAPRAGANEHTPGQAAAYTAMIAAPRTKPLAS